MDRLLLIDGSNLLFQMFFGMPNKIIGKNGAEIQGTVGFIGGLLKMIKMTSPTHVAVFFDGEHKNDRVEISPDYKANRPDYSNMPLENTPFSQLPYIRDALDFMKIKNAETDVCEADDWLAGYALKCSSNAEVIISSNDSDLFQLISDRVRILRYRGDASQLCDSEYVYSKLGVYPERYAEFKALVGDSSDNIKGCDKVGPKTAASLLSQFSSLDELIAGYEGISKPSVRKSVAESSDRILLNYKLIKLDYRGELPFSLRDMEFKNTALSTRTVLEGIGV